MAKSMSYYERKRYEKLTKENVKLQTQVTRLVGYKLQGGKTGGLVQINVISGSATLQLRGDTRIHRVKARDTFTVVPRYEL